MVAETRGIVQSARCTVRRDAGKGGERVGDKSGEVRMTRVVTDWQP